MPHTCDVGCLRWVNCHLLDGERRERHRHLLDGERWERHRGCWPGDVRCDVGLGLIFDPHAWGVIVGEVTRCRHGLNRSGGDGFLVDRGSRPFDDVGERFPHLGCVRDLAMPTGAGVVAVEDEGLPP